MQQAILSLMRDLLSGNTQAIKLATQALRLVLNDVNVIPVLLQFIQESPELQLRQMALVLLKQNFTRLYSSVNQDDRIHVRTFLLERFKSQEVSNIRTGLAILLGKIVRKQGLWPQLSSAFEQYTKSCSRKQSLGVFKYLLTKIPANPNLQHFIFQSLKDQETVLQALQCIIAMAQNQDYHNPKLLDVLIAEATHHHWQDDLVYQLLQIASTLSPKQGHLQSSHLQFFIKHILSNQRANLRLKTFLMDMLIDICPISKKLFSGENLKNLVQSACKSMFENAQLSEVSLQLLSNLAVQISTKKFYPIIFKIIEELFDRGDYNSLLMGFSVLTAIAEGCNDRLRVNLANPIMNIYIPKGLNCQSVQVRASCVKTVTFFLQTLTPEIIEYHRIIIPFLLNYILEEDKVLAEMTLVALQILLQKMDQIDCSQASSTLIPLLIQVLISAGSTVKMKAISISAIASCLVACGQSFSKYLKDCDRIIEQALKCNSVESLPILVQGTKLLGQIGGIFLKESCQYQKEVLQQMVKPRVETIFCMLQKTQFNQIKEACFLFFYNLAGALQNQFQPLFDRTFQAALKSIRIQDIIPVQTTPVQLEIGDNQWEDQPQNYTTSTPLLNQKTSALHAVGQLAKACPFKFHPHFQQTLDIANSVFKHYYSEIRLKGIGLFDSLLISLIKHNNKGIVPTYQTGLPCKPLDPVSQQFLQQHYLPRLVISLQSQDSEEKSTVIDSLVQMLKIIGPCLLHTHLEQIVQFIAHELTLDEDQDEDQTDLSVFQSLTDLIPRLTKVYKHAFAPALDKLYPLMMVYTDPDRDINDNIQIIGCLAQCFKHLGKALVERQQFLLRLMETMVNELNQQDLNQNIAYCLGMMMQGNPQSMKPRVNTVLLLLKVIWEKSISPIAKDNAIASICRCILTCLPPLPYDQFVPTLLSSLPLKADQKETRTCLQALYYLSQIKHSSVSGQECQAKIQQISNYVLQNNKKYKLKGQGLTRCQNFLKNCK